MHLAPAYKRSYSASMPKKKKIPKHGRSQSEIQSDYSALHGWSDDVPLGNTDPTVVHGKMVGGMPNKSRRATGGLRVEKGRR